MPMSNRASRPARGVFVGLVLLGLMILSPPSARAVNATLGPAGFGPERWVSGTAVLDYRVDFENVAGVSAAPVQVARVTVPLDASLDVATFRLGNAGFGGNFGHVIVVPSNRAAYDNGGVFYSDLGFYVQYTAGVDPLSRTATFTFSTLDVNQLPPSNPAIAFLPVNDATGRGQGFVTFRVRARADAEQGAVVATAASIRLDLNAPLLTSPVQNTLDTQPPTSQVLPPVLPLGGSEYALSVQSEDGLGCGVDQLSLFLSTDGGPYVLAKMVPATVLDSLPLPSGHLYAIYSRATDFVGQVEPIKTLPDVMVDLTSGTLGVGPGGHATRPALAITSVAGARVTFALGAPERITATVFDVQGRPVRTLATGAAFAAGEHSLAITWDGAASGIYFVEVRAGEHRAMRRFVHLR